MRVQNFLIAQTYKIKDNMSNWESKSDRSVNINFGNLTGNVADLKDMNLNAGATAAKSLKDAASALSDAASSIGSRSLSCRCSSYSCIAIAHAIENSNDDGYRVIIFTKLICN